MKPLLYTLLIVVGVVLIAYMLAATVGMLIYVAIAAVILGIAVALVRYWVSKHQARKQPLRKHAQANKSADRALKDMERTINKQ